MRRTVKSNKSRVRRPAEAEGASPGVRSVSSSCSKQLSSGDVTPGQLSLPLCPVVCCVQSVSSLCPVCGQQWGRQARSALPFSPCLVLVVSSLWSASCLLQGGDVVVSPSGPDEKLRVCSLTG